MADQPDPDALTVAPPFERAHVRMLAVLSLHTSPLVQPGSGDSGGMNVYVRELVSSLAQAGVHSEVFVRRWHAELPDVVDVEPGFRVVHVDAGPPGLAKEQLPDIVGAYTEGVARHLRRSGTTDAIHQPSSSFRTSQRVARTARNRCRFAPGAGARG